jgi:hypothetical protein
MYRDAMAMTWEFFEAQRSGTKRKTGKYPERPTWRGDSHLDDVVAGGWYNGADTTKSNFPLSSSVTYLAWGLLEFSAAYTTAQRGYAIADLRHVSQYLLNCWDGKNKVYVGVIMRANSATYCTCCVAIFMSYF